MPHASLHSEMEWMVEETKEALELLPAPSEAPGPALTVRGAAAHMTLAVLLLAAAFAAACFAHGSGVRVPATGGAAAQRRVEGGIINLAAAAFNCSAEMAAWSQPQKEWCCSEGGRECSVAAQFAAKAWAMSDFEPTGPSVKEQVSMSKGDMVAVLRKHSSGWTYISRHGNKGWVPDSNLTHAKAVAAVKDVQATREGGMHQPQLSLVAGDAVWLKDPQASSGRSLAFAQEHEGWVPLKALHFTVDGLNVNAAPAFVTQDFHANPHATHKQISLRKGDVVWIAGELYEWTFVASLHGGQGWVPGTSLFPMQAALVLRASGGSASGPGGPQPRLPVHEGDTVWVTNRIEEGWLFVQSEGQLGWLSAEVLRPPEISPVGLPMLTAKPPSPRKRGVKVLAHRTARGTPHTIVADPTGDGRASGRSHGGEGGGPLAALELAALIAGGVVALVALVLVIIVCIRDKLVIMNDKKQRRAYCGGGFDGHISRGRTVLTAKQIDKNRGKRAFNIEEFNCAPTQSSMGKLDLMV